MRVAGPDRVRLTSLYTMLYYTILCIPYTILEFAYITFRVRYP
jgi:hypothetical protein